MAISDKSVAGASMIAGAVGLLPVLATIMPALKSVQHFEEARHLYADHIRRPLLALFHIDQASSSLAPFAVDALILWSAIFVAINAFNHNREGLLIWGHIQRNYCFTKAQTQSARVFCTAPKFVVAFLLAPIVCLVSLYASTRNKIPYLTMGYMTVNPKETALYVLGLVALPVLVIGLFSVMGRH